MEDWRYSPRRGPRKRKGGIKAHTQRGGFAQSWWGRRWIGVLEEFDVEMRRGRGRSYARGGQVRSIDVSEGEIVASVQGSRLDPYQVTIRVRTLTQESWAAVAEAVAGRTVFAARLLAGEMPEGIEDIFIGAGLSLFPSRQDDLTMDCTCPDEAIPCKHIAAVHYLVAEEFDRDPFLIFRLRGLSREALSRLVVARRDSTEAGSPIGHAVDFIDGALPIDDTVRLAPVVDLDRPKDDPAVLDTHTFWGDIDTETPGTEEAVRIPSVSAQLAKRLGSFPFWRGERGFLATLERIYESASQVGMSVYLGETDPGAESEDL